MGISEILLLFKGDAAPALKSMAEVKGGMEEVGQSGNKLSGLGAIATGVAAGLLVVGAVVAGVGAISTKMAGDFQQATTQLVTGAGESASALDAVRQGILAMAPAVGQTPLELAKGMFMIESAGYHGADGLNVLRVAAEGAKVGGADLATTADAVTTVMKDYNIAASNAGDATNFLVSVVSQGKTHMQDLAASLSAILPTASALHVPLDQIGGAMATLTARGTPAANAATYLRFTLSALAAETPKGSKALEGIGLTSLEVGDTLTHKGLLPALQLVEEHLKTKFPQGGAAMFAALKDITGGTRGLGAALGLTGQNLSDFIASTGKVSKAIDDGHGKVIGWDLAQKDFNVRLDQLKAGAEAAAIGIGTKLLPVASAVIGWLADQTPKIVPFVMMLGQGVVGAASAVGKAIGGAIDIFRGLPAVLQYIISPLGFLAVHFQEVVGAVKYFTDQLSSGKSIWEAVQGTLLHLGVSFGDVSKVIGPLRSVLDALPGVFAAVGKVIGEVGKSLGEVGQAVLPALKDAFTQMQPAIKQLVTAFQQLMPLFQGIAIVIGAVLMVAFKVIIEVLKVVLPAAIHIFVVAFTVIADIVKLVADIIQGKWMAVVGDIIKLFQDFFGIVVDLFKMKFQAVIDLVSGFVSGIIGWFVSLWNQLIGHSIIPDLVNGIVNWFAQLPGRLMGAISSIPGAVAGLFGSIGGAVSGALGSLWNAITSAASTALNMAGNIGSNIVNGIKNGINSAIGALSAALHALAMLLPGPVKDALGIHSDSTVFAEIGGNMMGGLGAGITRSTAAVDALKAQVRAISGVVGSSSYTMAGALAGGAAGGAGGAITITQNVDLRGLTPGQVGPAMDTANKGLVDALMRELRVRA